MDTEKKFYDMRFKKMYKVYTWDDHTEFVRTEEGWRSRKEGVVLQSTGMRDINNKLIFEGDIVISDKHKFSGEVIWSEAATGEWAVAVEEAPSGIYDLKNTEEDIEVIGNVYDNRTTV